MTRIRSLRQARRPAARAASACAQFANPGRPSPCSFTPAQRVTLVEALESRVLLAVITVTTTADDGPGSLRQAILDANATPTIPDTIRFNIPGTGVPPAPGVRTIRPLSPLPLVVGPTSIDAKTQPGSALRPMVELDGSAAGPMADGIVFGDRSYSNLVRGLVINRFSRHGIVVDTGAELTQIESNYIGTDATGQIDLGNGGSGVVALGKAFVGGMRTADTDPGNVISGNEFAGVWVNLPGCTSTCTATGSGPTPAWRGRTCSPSATSSARRPATPCAARVTAADLAAIKRAIGSPPGAANRFDVNKDGLVNALDLGAARVNLNHVLSPITAPVAPFAPAEPALPAPSGVLPILADGTGDPGDGVWARLAT